MNYAQEIDRRQQELQTLTPRLAQIRKTFMGHAADHLKGLFVRMAKSEVEHKTDITLELDDGTLSRMKERVSELVDSAETISAEHLDRDELWRLPPEGESDRLPVSLSQHELSRRLEEGLRLALGHLGPVLAECGYVTTTPESDRHAIDVWCQYDPSGNRHKGGGKPRYPYGLDWSEQLKQDMDEYATRASQVCQLRSEISRVQSDWDRHKAASKWESL